MSSLNYEELSNELIRNQNIVIYEWMVDRILKDDNAIVFGNYVTDAYNDIAWDRRKAVPRYFTILEYDSTVFNTHDCDVDHLTGFMTAFIATQNLKRMAISILERRLYVTLECGDGEIRRYVLLPR